MGEEVRFTQGEVGRTSDSRETEERKGILDKNKKRRRGEREKALVCWTARYGRRGKTTAVNQGDGPLLPKQIAGKRGDTEKRKQGGCGGGLPCWG